MANIKINLSGHKNDALDSLGFTFPGALHVDLSDPQLSDKVAEFLSPYMGSGDRVIVALPGLAPLAILTVAVIHGLTGQFPRVQPLLRSPSNEFLPGPEMDLQDIRNNVARKRHREGVVRL